MMARKYKKQSNDDNGTKNVFMAKSQLNVINKFKNLINCFIFEIIKIIF